MDPAADAVARPVDAAVVIVAHDVAVPCTMLWSRDVRSAPVGTKDACRIAKWAAQRDAVIVATPWAAPFTLVLCIQPRPSYPASYGDLSFVMVALKVRVLGFAGRQASGRRCPRAPGALRGV